MTTINVKGPIISNGEKWIYDLFGEDATCPDDIISALPPDASPVTVMINSGGGQVTCGNEIYTVLKLYAGEVTTLVIEAASAASVIAMAGDTVKITPPGRIMIHNAAMGARGDYHEMDKCSEILRKVNRSIVNTYRLKTGMQESGLLELMDQETWFTAQEAKQYGFADEILFEDREIPLLTACAAGMLPQNIVDRMQELRKENITLNNAPAENRPGGTEKAKPVSPMTRFAF